MIMISNNPQTEGLEKKLPTAERMAVKGPVLAVLQEARKRVHRHWYFLADPGAGQDLFRRSPYLTVWMAGPGKCQDDDSRQWLEALILKETKAGPGEYDQEWLLDFQKMDASRAKMILEGLQEGSEGFD